MTSLANDTRYDDLMVRIREFASQEGMGKDSRIKWGLALLDAAYDGVIDDTKNKHGKDEDDAVNLCAEYALHQRKATQFDTKSDSGMVQISKARVVIRCGGLTTLGRGEPVANVNNLMDMRRKLRAQRADNLDDAYATLLRYCRLQLKSKDKLLDDPDFLRSLCLKTTPATKTVEAKLRAIHKEVDKLITGKGDLQFDCNELEVAREGLAGAIKVCGKSVDLTTPAVQYDDLPPTVTMDDVEAQRAKEEDEVVKEIHDEDWPPAYEDEETGVPFDKQNLGNHTA